jgi:internalin A
MKKIIILASGLAFLLQTMPTMAAPPQPAKTKTFTQWCQERNSVPAATKLTIDLLLKQADTQDCKQADAKLSILTELNLNDAKISDLQPLSSLTKLKSLDLTNNQIRDLKPIAGLTKLIGLGLGQNQISDLKPLAGLTKLTWLHLHQNKISNVKPLSGLSQLETLYLQYNQISDIQPLSTLKKLDSICVFKNKIGNKTLPIMKREDACKL